MTGRILVWDPPHVLEHEWRQGIVEDGVVRYELAEDGDATVLTFTHRGLGINNARGFIPGTHAFLDRLEPAWPVSPCRAGASATRRWHPPTRPRLPEKSSRMRSFTRLRSPRLPEKSPRG
jgi:Activator of Hsp90 ATPase homolog 1-like protein